LRVAEPSIRLQQGEDAMVAIVECGDHADGITQESCVIHPRKRGTCARPVLGWIGSGSLSRRKREGLSGTMTVTARSLSSDVARLIWRLAVYFVLLFGAFFLLSTGYRSVKEALGIHFAQAAGVKPAEAVGIGQALLLGAAVIAWAITA